MAVLGTRKDGRLLSPFLTRGQQELVPDDLVLLENRIVFDEARDELDHFRFHVQEQENGHTHDVWRVVRLHLLRYLPQETRQEPGLVDRMRTVLTGLYNQRSARYDLVEIKAGIFDGPELGVLQMYGAIGISGDLEAAERNARLGMAAIQGSMANFAQSRLEPLTAELAKWLRRALHRFPNALVVIGQPEARRGPRGMGREGPGEMGQQDGGPSAYTEQQGEMFCRALAARREEFLADCVEPR